VAALRPAAAIKRRRERLDRLTSFMDSPQAGRLSSNVVVADDPSATSKICASSVEPSVSQSLEEVNALAVIWQSKWALVQEVIDSKRLKRGLPR
jgi:hypothetical protein